MPEIIDTEPVWEAVESSSGGVVRHRIPVPQGNDLSVMQEAYLIQKSMPGMSAKSITECSFLVRKARSMGLSAIKGDVSLIEGRLAVSDAAKGRAVVCNPNLAEFQVFPPVEVINPILCACGHPKILHDHDIDLEMTEGRLTTTVKGVGICTFKVELKSGARTCKCLKFKPKVDVALTVTGRMKNWGSALTATTYLSEWYNMKNAAWEDYPMDRLVAKAIARWGERFSPIGEDVDAYLAPAESAPPVDQPAFDETKLRGLLSAQLPNFKEEK